MNQLFVSGANLHRVMKDTDGKVETALSNQYPPPAYIQAVWLRFQHLGFELPFMQYRPRERNWDPRELEVEVPGFVSNANEPGLSWTLRVDFDSNGNRIILEIGNELRDYLLPFLDLHFHEVFCLDLAGPLAEYIHMQLAHQHEEESGRGRDLTKLVEKAAEKARDALRRAKGHIGKAIDVLQHMKGSEVLQAVVNSAAFKDLERQLTSASHWNLSVHNNPVMREEVADLLGSMYTSVNGKPALVKPSKLVESFLATGRLQLRVYRCIHNHYTSICVAF